MLRVALLLAVLRCSGAFDFEDEDDSPAGQLPTFFGDEGSGLAVQLEHSLNGGPWLPRGKLFYRDSKHSGTGAAGRASARASQAKLSGADLDDFQAQVATGGYYTVRLPSVLSDPESPPVFTSVSTCSLLASRFEEHLQLNLLSNGRLAGLSYLLPKVTPACPTKGLPRLALDEVLFNTTVSVRFPDEGPKPLGKVAELSFLPPAAQAAARQAEAGEGGEGAQQQQQQGSFLRRYWMYILPAVIMLTMGGGEEPKEGDKAPVKKK